MILKLIVYSSKAVERERGVECSLLGSYGKYFISYTDYQIIAIIILGFLKTANVLTLLRIYCVTNFMESKIYY